MIELLDINFRYTSGDFTMHIPDLKVEAEECAAVIGPSGSGKTTLLNLLSGILKPQTGSIYVNGENITEKNDGDRRRFRIVNFGFIFQEFGLIEYLDVIDNIVHPYRITDALQLDEKVRKRAHLLAEQMGIGKRSNHYPSTLSHGEKQRVAICRALLPKPKIILADEATGNLDPKNKIHIMNSLLAAVKENKATLLAVTHDRDLLKFFDRTIDFNDFLVESSCHA